MAATLQVLLSLVPGNWNVYLARKGAPYPEGIDIG
jgi:hypothetical protein